MNVSSDTLSGEHSTDKDRFGMQLEFSWAQEGVFARADRNPPASGPSSRLPGAPREWPSRQPVEPLHRRESIESNREALTEKGEALRRAIEKRSGLKIALIITDNTSSVISFKHNGPSYTTLRLHHMFVDAPPRVVQAVAVWMRQPRRKSAGRVLDAFIRENRHRMRERTPQRVRIRARGRVFNLAELFDEVNAAHFGGSVTARITWGRWPTARPRRSIRFGSYASEMRLIRIHPALDQAFVPRPVVRFIVFHEMLHAHLGVEESESGRRLFHTREFRRLERAYPGFEEAEGWQADPANLRQLFRGSK